MSDVQGPRVGLREIALDPAALGLGPTEAREVAPTVLLGRACLRFPDTFRSPVIPALELRDGVVEADLLVPAERSFHGLQWPVRGDDAETFFVRPHQVGNPDAIQYTPVSHGISSWQLYHGPGGLRVAGLFAGPDELPGGVSSGSIRKTPGGPDRWRSMSL